MLRHGEKFSRTKSRDRPVKLRLGLGLGLKLYWEKFYKAIWILAERL